MNSKTIQHSHDSWIHIIMKLTVLFVLLFLFYKETVISIVDKWWTSDTFAHGMVIVPFSLYMIWIHRQQLASLQPMPSWWGMALLLPSVFVWLLGSSIDVLIIQQFALLGMVWGLVLAVLGWIVVKQILFPLAFLIFAIPFGEGLIPILMDFTAVFTVNALLLTGIPVYWEGLYFSTPSGKFEVVKACSGSRYLFASVALGCLFAYINYNSYKKRSLFILASIILPIIANGFRAYGIVLIAHYSNLKYAVGVDHLIYGWLFFGFVMFLLFYIGSKWREDGPRSKTVNTLHLNSDISFRMTIPTLSLIIATTGPMVMFWMHREFSISNEIVLHTPQGSGLWQEVNARARPPWKISFNGASHEVKASYGNPGKSQIVHLYVGYYANETQDSELINQLNQFYFAKEWAEVKRSKFSIEVSDKYIHLQEKLLRSGGYERIIWYGYDLDGFVTSNIYAGKLVQAWRRLTGSDRGGAVVVLMGDVVSDRHATITQMKEFIKSVYPSIQYSLTEARKSR